MRYVVLVEGRCYNLLRMLVARRRGVLLRLCLHSPDIGGVKGFVFYLPLLVVVVILCVFVLFGGDCSLRGGLEGGDRCRAARAGSLVMASLDGSAGSGQRLCLYLALMAWVLIAWFLTACALMACLVAVWAFPAPVVLAIASGMGWATSLASFDAINVADSSRLGVSFVSVSPISRSSVGSSGDAVWRMYSAFPCLRAYVSSVFERALGPLVVFFGRA